MIFGNYDGRNYSITLERQREVFSIQLATLVQYTTYNKPYALNRPLSDAQLLLTAEVLTNKLFPGSFSSS